jgi:hypothetical protein
MKLSRVILVCLLFSLAGLWAQDGTFKEIDETYPIKNEKPLEIWLDIDAGEVMVERGSDSREVELYMKFTRGEFHEDIDFDGKRNKLKIKLDKRNWHRIRGNGDFDEDDIWALVELRLPDDVEIFFDSKVKAGEVTMLVGGLSLKEFFLNNWAGEVEIRFDEPNKIPMEYLDINAKVGEVHVLSVGNARFERANINGGIGELRVDFSGDLLEKSEARVDLDIGEATVDLPYDAGIKMKVGGGLSWLSHKNIDRSMYRRGNSYYSDDYDDHDKRLYVRISPGLGELNIRRD